ncbi:hypothetical protein AB7M16_001458 [Bradyrhizobium sp. USDA 372]
MWDCVEAAARQLLDALVSRTRCSALALLRRAGTQRPHATPIHGPRLCSESRKCALRCVRGTGSWLFGVPVSTIVIASAAKQSSPPPRKDSGLLRCARNDGMCGTSLRSSSALFIADISPRSRGAFRPSFSAVLRPSIAGGRREGRAPAAPESVYKEMHTGWTTGVAGRPAFPARMVLTVSFVLSSGSVALLPPSPYGFSDARTRSGRRITASLDAQTPGVRTTRLLRPRTVLPDHQELACAHPRQSTRPL